jgi:protoporphyrinogen IX oxidase
MHAWLAGAFVWFKALHIIAVIAWMAGLLYLPRLFVYHADVAPESETAATFKVMERRLLRRIVNPAGIAVWVFGILLILASPPELIREGWLHAKLALVVALTVLHHLFARWRKDFERGANRHSVRFYRIVNEVPALIVILVVILVVVKPF